MRNLEIDSATTLAHILNELKTTDEDGLELTVVPGEKNILDNSLTKSIIEKVAKEFKKEVVFPASPIESAPEVEVENDDLGFIDGEDIVVKTPIEDVHQMIQPEVAIAGTAKIKKTPFDFKKYLKNKWAIIGGGVAVVIILIAALLFILPSAEVNIVLSSDSKDSQVNLTGSPTQKTVDVNGKIIPIQAQSITKDGADQAGATGKKTIGTYAKGRVTIYNLDTDSDKSFIASSTILTPTATSSATFKLDNDIVVPKAPALGSSSSVGVNVTATKAGTDSNLPAGTTFKINTISSLVYAKNDLDFSGGSSKLATVVSSDDRDALKTKIVTQLTKDATDQLGKIVKGSLVIDGSVQTTVTKETYDPKAVDAEGDTLKATITLQAKANTVTSDDLKKILVKSLETSVKDQKVDENNLQISVSQLENKTDGTLTLLGKITAKLIPIVDPNEIKRNIVGKNLSQVGNYLDSQKNIDSYKVTTSPSFLRFLSLMPFSGSKIKVNLTSK